MYGNKKPTYESPHKRKRVDSGEEEFDTMSLGDISNLGDMLKNSLEKADDNIYAEENHIYFRSTVTSDSVDKLIKLIRLQNMAYSELKKLPMIATMKPKPIYLHITTYGGCLLSGFRAVDAIQRSEIPVYTVVDGPSASAGTLMSVVGKKRFMTPTSWMLIHQLSGGSGGTYWNVKDDFQNSTAFMEQIYEIYEEHTDLNREQLEKYLSHDSWWGAQQCLDVGLIDEIYKKDY